MMKKSVALLLIYLTFTMAFSAASVTLVCGVDYTRVGVNEGDWATYEAISWQSNATIKLIVRSAIPGLVDFEENDSYTNGTTIEIPPTHQDTDFLEYSSWRSYHSLLTDFLSLISPPYQYPIFVCTNLSNGDDIYPPTMTGSFHPKINANTSRNILGEERQVNILNMTNSCIEYDKQSGILVKLIINQPNPVNVTISGTSIWPSASRIPIIVLVPIGVTLVVVAAVLVIHKRQKKEPGEPSSFPEEISQIIKQVKLGRVGAEGVGVKGIKMALELAGNCVSEDGRIHPKVAAVILKKSKIFSGAYRGELGPGEHAEYTLLVKKCTNADLRGATLITTLEPCTTRKHDKKPCVQHIIDRGIKRVVVGMIDPNPEIRGKGILFLQKNNVQVELFPSRYQAEVKKMNRDFWENEFKKYSTDLMKT